MKVRFILNGQEVEAEKGETILEVAQRLGIKIPTLCYHPALTPYGSCRLCVIELKKGKRTRIVTSCVYQVEDGIEVITHSERILKIRKIILELLLARCPESVKLKEFAESLGVKETRFESCLLPFKELKDCILCGLCVRVCNERMGQSAISFISRGPTRKIQLPVKLPLDICQTCGACIAICPMNAIKIEDITKKQPMPIGDEFDLGLKSRPVIHIPYPQAVPNVATIDAKNCIHFLKDACGICQEVCTKEAIDFNQKEEIINIETGAIILTPGYDKFDAHLKPEYGYGRFQNVLTSLEFERILSASGPFRGHLKRLSDDKEPSSIAFVQCVGSRDLAIGNDYCSSVCCTYAIKEAIIAKEHLRRKEVSLSIFGMDIRTYGKGFEEYYNRAKTEYGIRFIRARVSQITEIPSTKSLILRYETEDGSIKEEEFDLVVLSVGFKVNKEIKELSKRLGIELNEYGFCKTSELNPIDTSRPGIFVCGAFQAPKDIPETVMQASSAACQAQELLKDVRGTQIKERKYPQEIDVKNLPPRIGVFVCHCGINIGAVVNVPSVVEYVKGLPFVVHVEENLYTCSKDTQERIKEMIKTYQLNRVVVAACTPRTHEPLFQQTLREAGLNPYLFEMANIRDQCSWVHQQTPKEATQKAKELIEMACAKAANLEPLYSLSIPVIPKALVIGGGLAGMTAALSLASQGFETYLVEKEKELGGNLKYIYYTLDSPNIQEYLKSICEKIEKNNLIHLYLNSQIKDIDGFVGNYKTTVVNGDGLHTLEHGVVIVTTGGLEYEPKEYLYGQDERILTQRQLEEKLVNHQAEIFNIKCVVMIQCVGSRDSERPYCSRYCCQEAIKNALKLKEINPNINVFILYRDIRTYGFLEIFYKKAREEGIIFIRYDEDNKPQVRVTNGKLQVSVFDPILKEDLLINPNLLILSTGIIPYQENKNLSKLLKVPLTKDGFFLEAHVKLRPVEFATDGVFLAGLCHSPKNISETISQAKAASAKASILLSKGYIETEGKICKVDVNKCNACGMCENICPYKAIELVFDERTKTKKAKVNEALCKGCGLCVATCKCYALDLQGFSQEQMFSAISSV